MPPNRWNNRLILGLAVGVFALLSLLLGTYLSPPSADPEDRPSTFFTDPTGARGLLLVLEQYAGVAEAWRRPLTVLGQDWRSAGASLVVARPEQPLTRGEAQFLQGWLSRGGQLILVGGEDWRVVPDPVSGEAQPLRAEGETSLATPGPDQPGNLSPRPEAVPETGKGASSEVQETLTPGQVEALEAGYRKLLENPDHKDFPRFEARFRKILKNHDLSDFPPPRSDTDQTPPAPLGEKPASNPETVTPEATNPKAANLEATKPAVINVRPEQPGPPPESASASAAASRDALSADGTPTPVLEGESSPRFLSRFGLQSVEEDNIPEPSVATYRDTSSENLSWNLYLRRTVAWRGEVVPLLLSHDGRPAAVQIKVGLGQLVLVGDHELLTNRGLRYGDNAVWLVRLLLGWGDVVYFDEYHLGFGQRRSLRKLLWGLAFSPWGWALLQVLLAGGFYVLGVKRRFGRLVEDPTPPQFSPLDLITARASLFRGARASGLGAEQLILELCHALSVQSGQRGDPEAVLREAAERNLSPLLTLEVNRLVKLLERARREEPVSEAELLKLAQLTGRIHQELSGRRA